MLLKLKDLYITKIMNNKKEDLKDFGLGCLSMILGVWVILYVVDWLLTLLFGSL